MDVIQKKRRYVFFNNLLLLGFEKDAMEERYGVQFHRDMFVKPNKKAFEVVTHFLFSKLTEVSSSNYSFPWPLLCLEHERQFQKTCFSYLSSIAQESSVKFPIVQSSVISTFGGERFCELYFALSCYVIEKSIQNTGCEDKMSRPILHENFEDTKEVLLLATRISEKNWMEIKEISLKALLLWCRCAKDLCTFLRKLNTLETSYRALLKEKINIAASLYGGERSSRENSLPVDIFTKVFISEKKVKCLWEQLRKFLDKEETAWQCISSEIEENEQKHIVVGSEFQIYIPDILTELGADSKKIKCQISEPNGKLLLKRILETFSIVLEFWAKNLQKLEMIKFPEHLIENCTLSEDLSNVRLLNTQLNVMIPDMKENVQQLKESAFLNEVCQTENLYEEFPLVSSAINLKAETVGDQAHCSNIDDSLSKIFTSSNGLCFQSFDFSILKEQNISQQIFKVTDVSMCMYENIIERNSGDLQVNQELDEKIAENEFFTPNIETCSFELISGASDFSVAKHFKMRKSWANVECLDAMTLPELLPDETE